MLGGVNAHTDAQTEAPPYQLLTILPLNPGESGKIQIPPDSSANAFTGCLHAGEGAGHTCMDDLVVKLQTGT